MPLSDSTVLNQLIAQSLPIALDLGKRLVGAIALWIGGRLVITAIRRVVLNTLESRRLDPTLIRYISQIVGVALRLVLFVLILGVFGIETTTLAGLLTATGVAIGMAWSGLLSHFAAGVFLMALRPFKVGDEITAGGVTGHVQEIGLFVTTIHTEANICTYVGNGKILGDSIHNYSTNPRRRVDLTAQLAHSVDPADALRRLRPRLSALPHVLDQPAPLVEVGGSTLSGPTLAIQLFAAPRHYWQVYYAAGQAIHDEFLAAGYPPPSRPSSSSS